METNKTIKFSLPPYSLVSMVSTAPQSSHFPRHTTPHHLRQQVRLEIRAIADQIVAWRRHLHRYPELGFQEEKTTAFIQQQLTAWGIDYEAGLAKTGIVATIQGLPGDHTLGIRADMDGLPVQEENEVDYCSQHPGKMHACGHDGHTAIALGTAYYLHQYRHSFRGTVKIIFQPAEEGPGGAKPMLEAGLLEKHPLDGILGLHLWNNLPLGTVGVRTGPLMAAVELFDCEILGKGGHGAMPEQTVDAVVVGAQVVNALQTIVARNINPLDSAVVTVGEFKAGSTRNVIADRAQLRGTIRYFNPQVESVIGDRLETLIKGVCDGHGAQYRLNHWRLYPPVINDRALAELVRAIALEVVETELGVVPECQTMGGEDFSFFQEQVPGCYFFLGAANAEKGLAFPHHHPRFNFDETALPVGVEMFARAVERFLPLSPCP